jgi:hypothetical protein
MLPKETISCLLVIIEKIVGNILKRELLDLNLISSFWNTVV